MNILKKLRTAALTVVLAALAITTTTAVAGSGVGDVFNLGQTNSVDGTSTLTGTTSAAQLQVGNASTGAGSGVWGLHTGTAGTGAGVRGQSASVAGPGVLGVNTAGGPGLAAIVNAGKAPLSVNSSVRVTNLNADKVDGLDSTGFWKIGGNAGTVPGTNFLGTTGAQSLVFKTNGRERMRLSSDGDTSVKSQSLATEGFEGTIFPPIGWTTGGMGTSPSWVRDTTTHSEGLASAASGTIGSNESSYIELNETLPSAGLLSFDWKVSSEACCDFLAFRLDGVPVKQIAGEVDWTGVTVPIPAGSHTLRWMYSKDSTVNGGSDKGWLDDVSLTSGGNLVTDGSIDAGGGLTVANDSTFAGNSSFGGDVSIGGATGNQPLRLKVPPGHGEGMSIESNVAGHTPAIYLNHTGPQGRNYRIASFGNNTDPGSFRIRDETVGYDPFTIDALGTTHAHFGLDVDGVLGVTDHSSQVENAGVATEVSSRLLDIGVNDGSFNRFGGAYTPTNQGGFLRVDTRAGQPLFGFFGRPAGTAGDVGPPLGYIGSDGTVRFEIGTGHKFSLGGNGEFGIDANGTVNGRFVVKDGGNVGIGVPSPSNILAVQQNSATDPIADQWTTYSSRRWKTHVHTLHGALGKLERLRGVRFTWKETGKHDMGFIAEDVGKVFPGIVTWEKNGKDARGLDYSRLVPVLVQGVKQQQSEIHSQQTEIRSLRRQNDALAARMTRLERFVGSRNR